MPTYEGQPVHDNETQTVQAQETTQYRAPQAGGATAAQDTTGHSIAG